MLKQTYISTYHPLLYFLRCCYPPSPLSVLPFEAYATDWEISQAFVWFVMMILSEMLSPYTQNTQNTHTLTLTPIYASSGTQIRTLRNLLCATNCKYKQIVQSTRGKSWQTRKDRGQCKYSAYSTALLFVTPEKKRKKKLYVLGCLPPTGESDFVLSYM